MTVTIKGRLFRSANIKKLEQNIRDRFSELSTELFESVQGLTDSWSSANKPNWQLVNKKLTFRITGSNAKIFNYVDKGTKPHVIRPKNKKALRFKVSDNYIFSKEVHHPGFKGKNQLNPLVKKFNTYLNKELLKTAKRSSRRS